MDFTNSKAIPDIDSLPQSMAYDRKAYASVCLCLCAVSYCVICPCFVLFVYFYFCTYFCLIPKVRFVIFLSFSENSIDTNVEIS